MDGPERVGARGTGVARCRVTDGAVPAPASREPNVAERTERRTNPRLRIHYPVETTIRGEVEGGSTRALTSDLGARGLYFRTFSWEGLRVGQRVSIRVTVPHSLLDGAREVRLDMRTEGTVLRIERVRGRAALNEDGVPLVGVALEFDRPLEFRCDWL